MANKEVSLKPNATTSIKTKAGITKRVWINRKMLSKLEKRNPMVIGYEKEKGIVVSRVLDVNGNEIARMVMDENRNRVWLETEEVVTLEIL